MILKIIKGEPEMRTKLYLSTAIFFTYLSAYASEIVKEEEPYSVKAATCIKNVSTATLEAADKCIDTTGKCIKVMGPGLKIAIKIADFISRFTTSENKEE
ncbi:MAG: hypothetical protein BGO77_02815 [Caedibacter sp. 37-49]|nr:MAG: hypothetical protein BGO77_02815 [Caedibacter sp. 37-49]